MKKVLFVIGALVAMWGLTHFTALTDTADAAGFGIYEWSARGNAMGGALVATQKPDASAVAFNPATMTQLDGYHTMAGASMIVPQATIVFDDGETSKTEPAQWNVPHMYFTHKLEDNERVSVGIGLYSRFGLGNIYPARWGGSANLNKITFETASVTPSVAFQVTEDLSVAIAAEIVAAKIQLGRFVRHPAAGVYMDFLINAHGSAFGGSLSAHYTIDDQWALGFVYRAPMMFHGEGDVEVDGGLAAGLGYQSGNCAMRAVLPASYTMGLSYAPLENLSFEFDTIYTQWSSYKSFQFDFDEATSIPDSDSAKMFKNVWRFQFGLEYTPVDWLDLRAGLIFDQSPIRDGYEDFMLPTNDRTLYSLGAGFNWNSWELDLSYIYLKMDDRNVGAELVDNVDMEFKDGHAHIGAISVGYSF